MTSLVAWVGVDSRLPSSLYLASDSRISWGTVGSWDFGRKVFACEKSPHVLAYIGDVLFASVMLGQIASSIDAGALFAPEATPDQQFNAVVDAVRMSFAGVPQPQQRMFTVLFGLREGAGMTLAFHLFTIGWSHESGWSERIVAMPTHSATLEILGSGGAAGSEWHGRWEASSQGGTSRAIFAGFCDALSNGTDPLTGGAPQLVRLYREGPAAVTGVLYRGRPYLLGLPLQTKDVSRSIEWRNELFERCEFTGQRVPNAQRHGTPRGLGPQSQGC